MIDKLPIRLIKILDLTEESFHCLVDNDYIIKEAYKVFPNYLYYFLKENLWIINTEFLCRKVIDIDIKKFIKGKPVLTKDNIVQRLLREYRYYIKGFLLKNADELPLYYL